ncbi:hypothetical protein GCM10023219_12940 [Stakelama sediminis]|uniref:Negative regulator of flagellin synthesis FlgM n=1 Tax=Stakelama sediminis TaxID=463200 RepID=A0A840YWU0_9SPHN|nr:flagellar biosynthesis anti-sigma factor FlgM [Stakelama sediminis]MBB5718020.1 negative regulator of flagellin synthesis FlgM [Stakelama sediminis]
MVDSIGPKAVSTPVRDVKSVAPTAPSVQAEQATTQQARSSDSIATAAKKLADKAPIDSDHVAEVRRAVKEGRFPILPATVADRLLALKMQWNPNDPS